MNTRTKVANKKGSDKPALTPKLRFPEFRDSGGWEEKIVAQLITTITPPKKLPTSKYLAEGLFPIVDQSQNYICGWTNDHTALIKAELPLVVFGDHTCVLKLLDRPFAQGADGVKVIKTGTEITIEYLYQFLQLRPLMTESYKRHFSALNKKQVFHPKIKSGEQQKIADCLSSLDNRITAETQKLDALKIHKKGLMQQLFPQEGETVPRLRFPEFRDAPEWEETELGAICDMRAGKFVSASEIHEQSTEGLFPCYGGNGLRGYTTSFTHSGEYPLIGRQGAHCGNVKLGFGDFHATEHAVVVTTNDRILGIGRWLFYLLDFLNLNQYATGQAQPGLSVNVLKKVPLTIPNQKIEQQRIADCLSSLDDLIAAQGKKLDVLKIHKKGLMQQLFPSLEGCG